MQEILPIESQFQPLDDHLKNRQNEVMTAPATSPLKIVSIVGAGWPLISAKAVVTNVSMDGLTNFILQENNSPDLKTRRISSLILCASVAPAEKEHGS